MTAKRKGLLVFFLFLIAGGLVSAGLRHENTWDLYNYHYYNGFALLNGRVGIDLAPAFIMSFFNPLADSVVYLLIRAFNNRVPLYSFFTGLCFGGLMYVLFLINRLFFDTSTRRGRIACVLSLCAGATGFATWLQIGSSTNEIPVSILVLTGVYLLLNPIARPAIAANLKTVFLAGVLLGSAAGLKYTAAIYCLTSGIAFILFCKRISSRPVRALLLFIAGGLAGFLAFNGYWMYLMYKNYDSPFFPLFNAFFKSPWFLEINTRDQIHVAARSVGRALSVPLEMINHTKKKELVGFYRFTDVRFYFMYLFGAVFLCSRAFENAPKPRPQTLFLMTFAGTSFLVWLFFFSIIRYVIPFETVLPVLFAAALLSVAPKSRKLFRRAYIPLCVFVCAAMLVTPFASETTHLRGRKSVIAFPDGFDIPDNSLIFILNEPSTHLVVDWLKRHPQSRALSFSTQLDSTWAIAPYGITGYGKFKEKTAEVINGHDGAFVAIGHTAFPFLNDVCRPLNALSVVSGEKPLFYFACVGDEQRLLQMFPNLYMNIIDGRKAD